VTGEESPTVPKIIEKGLIYFFYRPKVGLDHAEGIEDVQKLYILLWPGAEPIKKDEKEMSHTEGKLGENEPERLIIISKKKLPEISHHAKYWGFVKKVSYRIEDIDKQLGAETYTTKTRGERHVEGARPIAEGVYALVKYHNGIHLAYVLELPEEPLKLQQAFNIGKEGSYIVQVKNPEGPGINFLGDKKAKYSSELTKYFIGKKGGPLKFAPAYPPLLDQDGAELLFIGASDDLKAELGETGEFLEELEEVDAKKLTNEKLWKELHLKKAEHPGDAILRGKWK